MTTPVSWMNFRDLGGTRAKGGVLRSGLLFRTAQLSKVDFETARHFRETLGIESYFDFRTDEEIERDGRPAALTECGVRWERRPFDIADPDFYALGEPTPRDWSALYERGFARLRPQVGEVIRAIARERAPAVFGCWAGKDRTGIVAGLLLSVLGVADEEVARDYARTTEGLALHQDRFKFLWQREPARRDQIFAAYCGAPTEVMMSFLAAVRELHGSATAALELDDSTVQTLKLRLLI